MNLLGVFALDLGVAWQAVPFDEVHLKSLTPDDRLAYLLDRASQVGVAPDGLDLLQLRRLFGMFQRNSVALRRYVPRKYEGPLTLFQASESLGGPLASEQVATWQALAGQGLRTAIAPGNHYTLLRAPQVEELAKQFKGLLHNAANYPNPSVETR